MNDVFFFKDLVIYSVESVRPQKPKRNRNKDTKAGKEAHEVQNTSHLAPPLLPLILSA